MPTENDLAVTEDMINEWCAAYDAGKIPAGYERAEPVIHGQPHILDDEIASDEQPGLTSNPG